MTRSVVAQCGCSFRPGATATCPHGSTYEDASRIARDPADPKTKLGTEPEHKGLFRRGGAA